MYIYIYIHGAPSSAAWSYKKGIREAHREHLDFKTLIHGGLFMIVLNWSNGYLRLIIQHFDLLENKFMFPQNTFKTFLNKQENKFINKEYLSLIAFFVFSKMYTWGSSLTCWFSKIHPWCASWSIFYCRNEYMRLLASVLVAKKCICVGLLANILDCEKTHVWRHNKQWCYCSLALANSLKMLLINENYI